MRPRTPSSGDGTIDEIMDFTWESVPDHILANLEQIPANEGHRVMQRKPGWTPGEISLFLFMAWMLPLVFTCRVPLTQWILNATEQLPVSLALIGASFPWFILGALVTACCLLLIFRTGTEQRIRINPGG